MLRAGLLLFALTVSYGSAKFKVTREWRYVNFTWPSVEVYQNALQQRTYVPENIIIAGLKYFDGFYYVTLPRMKDGVPATLARIPAGVTSDTAPLLSPYPSWELNNVEDCNALQNVQNVEIDPKGQIWIIDGGRTETMSPRPVVKCKPKLVVFDINKNDSVLTYTFPDNVASFNGSFLYDIVVDNTGDGYAYITDNSGRDPGIIVFSVKDHHSWKIRHSQSMRADPKAVYFSVNGVAVSAAINVASIALGPRIHTSSDKIVVNEDREVFYAPLSSLHLYSINSSVLRNEDFGNQGGEFQGSVRDYGLKESQSVGMVMDNQGILYYSLLGSNSIAKWDSHTPFVSGQKIIAKDERYLEWTNSLAFDDSGNLTLLVNRLQRFIYDKLNLNEPNFRLISSNIGAKSYLYDENYNYQLSSTSSPATSSSTTEEEPIPLKPGSDQDPYMAPQPLPDKEEPKPEPEPEPTPEPEPEPTVQPEPSPEPTSKSQETKNEDVSTEAPRPRVSSAIRLGVTFWSLITATVLFVV